MTTSDVVPSVVQNLEARQALLRGAEVMVRLLRPTLGPVGRTVLVAPILGQRPPEVLASAGAIARRTYALPEPTEDVGAMLIRQLTWRVSQDAGDGAATAAVLAGRLIREGERVIAAGASPIAIRRGIERGVSLAVESLRQQARPITDRRMLTNLLQGSLREPKLAEMVTEMVVSVGVPDGVILIEDAYGAETSYEYVEGLRWPGGWHASIFQPNDSAPVRLVEPLILVTDRPIERPEDLAPALIACLSASGRNLFVVAPAMSDAAVSLLVVNRERGVLEGAVGVKLAAHGILRTRIGEDIAVATGGRCIRTEAGDRLADVTACDLGRARLAWAGRSQFGILGGRGVRAAIRARIAEARAELGLVGDDAWLRSKTRERIAMLAGTAAVILVGAPTTSARAELKARVEGAAAMARAALLGGVVAGGGAAYVACAARLEQEVLGDASDEAAGMRALARALTEPMAAIAENAGHERGPIIAEARRRGATWIFDAVGEAWVEAHATGILDPLSVLETVLVTSASGAATALTIGAVVHRREPELAKQP